MYGKFFREYFPLVFVRFLMLMSDPWIPLNLSYEEIFEEKLAKDRRHFIKLLIYDSTEDHYHFDFTLTAVNNSDYVLLEIYGRDITNYSQYKEVKTA